MWVYELTRKRPAVDKRQTSRRRLTGLEKTGHQLKNQLANR
jgi:hypothetical protein